MSPNYAKRASATLFWIASLSLMLAFQNCGTQSVFEKHSASSKEIAESNGNGYQGKVYVQMGPCGTEPWAEKNKIIVSLDDSVAHEIINDCTKLILPNPLPMSSISFAVDSLMYMSNIYSYVGTTDNPLPYPTPAPASGGSTGGSTSSTPPPASTTPPTAASLNLCQSTSARVILHCKDKGTTMSTYTAFQSSSGSLTGIACTYSGSSSSSFSSSIEINRDAGGRIIYAKSTASSTTAPTYELQRGSDDAATFNYRSSSITQIYNMSCTDYP